MPAVISEGKVFWSSSIFSFTAEETVSRLAVDAISTVKVMVFNPLTR